MIDGEVAPGFEVVRDAFTANFSQHGDVGAAFALYVGGEKVVDIWGGAADLKTERPWAEDTLALVFSTTKGVTAILANLLAQRGLLDLDAPVARYWPEFAAEGKAEVPVRWLLSHRAGLPTVEEPTTADEALAWEPVVERLAAQRPRWEPGTRHGYHAITFGWLVGEVLRRATGRRIGQLVSDELSGPLDLDLWIGLPEAQEGRVCRLRAQPLPPAGEPSAEPLPDDVRRRLQATTDPSSLTWRALNPTTPPFNFNSRQLHAAEIPAGNAITTARSLAKLYAATVGGVDGVRLLAPATVEDATRERSSGPDEVLLTSTRFGSGFMLPSGFQPLLGPRSFGHPGAGGSLGFADPEAGVGFGYVMNSMQANLAGDPRTTALVEAVRRCL